MNWITSGTTAFINIDTYAYSSIQGTLEPIKMTLAKGRINDSYALLRKYYDVTIINVYTNLYLETQHSFDNFIVEDIDKWVKVKRVSHHSGLCLISLKRKNPYPILQRWYTRMIDMKPSEKDAMKTCTIIPMLIYYSMIMKFIAWIESVILIPSLKT